MYLMDLNTIEYEFMPNLIHDRERGRFQNTKFKHLKRNQHKKRHHRTQHPSTYLTSSSHFYNTNSSGIQDTIRCLNVNSPCNYGPMLIFTQGGILICLFITIYSLCMACKPKARKDTKICAIAV